MEMMDTVIMLIVKNPHLVSQVQSEGSPQEEELGLKLMDPPLPIHSTNHNPRNWLILYLLGLQTQMSLAIDLVLLVKTH